MAKFDHIESEMETHRTAKAIAKLAPELRFPLERGAVRISIGDGAQKGPAGQHLLVMLVHLLARMKGIVSEIGVVGLGPVEICPSVPLVGVSLREGLGKLVESINGPLSKYPSSIRFTEGESPCDVLIGVGTDNGDIVLGADAWRALIGFAAAEAQWDDHCPLGPYLASVIGCSEVLKRLLRVNSSLLEFSLVRDLSFSLINYGINGAARVGPDVEEIQLKDLAVAGAGAGGTAVLYTLSSFDLLKGQLTIVEPGYLKKSNLNRYLMSTYGQVHSGVHKIDSVLDFMHTRTPDVKIVTHRAYWHQVQEDWNSVIATVDTPQGRRDVQRSNPEEVLEAGVIGGTLYSVLRVVPGGMCLECKHPYREDEQWIKRSRIWGLEVDEVRRKYRNKEVVTKEEVERLAQIQNRPFSDLMDLVGVPFDKVPALTECGETTLSLKVPAQRPVLPLGTTAAGVVLAAEVVKASLGLDLPRLSNWFEHDLKYLPREEKHRFRPRRPDCPTCSA